VIGDRCYSQQLTLLEAASYYSEWKGPPRVNSHYLKCAFRIHLSSPQHLQVHVHLHTNRILSNYFKHTRRRPPSVHCALLHLPISVARLRNKHLPSAAIFIYNEIFKSYLSSIQINLNTEVAILTNTKKRISTVGKLTYLNILGLADKSRWD
jgi:hypothetical protein